MPLALFRGSVKRAHRFTDLRRCCFSVPSVGPGPYLALLFLPPIPSVPAWGSGLRPAILPAFLGRDTREASAFSCRPKPCP